MKRALDKRALERELWNGVRIVGADSVTVQIRRSWTATGNHDRRFFSVFALQTEFSENADGQRFIVFPTPCTTQG